MIAVITHHKNGGRLESQSTFGNDPWTLLDRFTVSWNFAANSYRPYIPPPIAPTIPWEYIDKKYNYAAWDEDGRIWVYMDKPITSLHGWVVVRNHYNLVINLCGFERGNLPWNQTLCIRPNVDNNSQV
jgi:hypothetical protein